MRWIVAKSEWGKWVTDFAPFDSFNEACKVAFETQHYNVVTEHVFHVLESLPQTPSRWVTEENPETD